MGAQPNWTIEAEQLGGTVGRLGFKSQGSSLSGPGIAAVLAQVSGYVTAAIVSSHIGSTGVVPEVRIGPGGGSYPILNADLAVQRSAIGTILYAAGNNL